MDFVYRSDPEFMRQVQQEMYAQKHAEKPRVVALPCGHGSVQVTGPASGQPIALECPACRKTHYLVWTPYSDRHRWETRT